MLGCAGGLTVGQNTISSGSVSITSSVSPPPPAHTSDTSLHKTSTNSSAESFSSSDGPSLSTQPKNNILGPSNQTYLELCVNTGEYTKTLSEINLRSISCDGELFKAKEISRSIWMRYHSLLTLENSARLTRRHPQTRKGYWKNI